jgi:hypothetical protein
LAHSKYQTIAGCDTADVAAAADLITVHLLEMRDDQLFSFFTLR